MAEPQHRPDDDSFAANVAGGVGAVMLNSGQTCTAPTRMLVPAARMDEAIEAVRALEPTLVVGDPTGEVRLGPVVSEAQFDKIQTLIQSGLESGARRSSSVALGVPTPARPGTT